MAILRKWMLIILATLLAIPAGAQKKGLKSITAHDLKMDMLFLASDELEGRASGEKGLDVAAKYIAVQAQEMGLKEASPGKGYIQPFRIVERYQDHGNRTATILIQGQVPQINRDPFYLMTGEGDTEVEGAVVFAGYGIHDAQQGYDDLEGLDLKDKIVLIMSRSPMNEEGNEPLLEGYATGENNRQGLTDYSDKLPYIFSKQPRAVLQVMDPKSGRQSLEEMSSGYASYISRSRSLEGADEEGAASGDSPRMILINRSLADQLLESTGKNLTDLQLEIDRNLAPRSFELDGVRVRMELKNRSSAMKLSNVFGLIEGSDPVLKDQIVIYMAHFDHMGTDGNGEVYNGADDNASGSVALMEIAEAFLKEKKRPKRSVGFLWVSAEELGLLGSEYFAGNPMVPIEQIAAVINLDMVGRTKNEADLNSDRQGLTISGGDTVKVIGGLQSRVLMGINAATLEEMGMVGNYAYNDVNHPDRYYFRSDHFSFAEKDIPVMFYSTGTHNDYHRVTDVEERIDYDKFLKMTRLGYMLGYNVAGYKGAIEVDNPMSAW